MTKVDEESLRALFRSRIQNVKNITIILLSLWQGGAAWIKIIDNLY